MASVLQPMISADVVQIYGGTMIHQVIQSSVDVENVQVICIRDALRDHIVFDATWDSIHDFYPPPSSFEKDPGHPSAFVETFEELKCWYQEPIDVGTPVKIIYGPSASGKTTMSRKIAQQAKASNLLAASFFFNVTCGRRKTHLFLIPTLAFQLSISIPQFRPHLLAALRIAPDVIGQSLSTQFRTLLLEPLQAMANTRPESATKLMLIVLDGLDECSLQPARQVILNAIIQSPPVIHEHFRFLVTVNESIFVSDLPGYAIDLKTPEPIVSLHKLGLPGRGFVIQSTTVSISLFSMVHLASRRQAYFGLEV